MIDRDKPCAWCAKHRTPEHLPNPYPPGSAAHQWHDFAAACDAVARACRGIVEKARQRASRR